ncbi:MAG: DUF4258 domain-containing protein [Chloroflexota bacterium]
MPDYEFSEHAYVMLKERNIQEVWVQRAIENPDVKEEKQDGTVHYLRAIPEHGYRYLRVVVNPEAEPQRVVTLFFDRRTGRSV